MAQGNYAEAAAQFEHSLKLDPVKAYGTELNLALAEEKLGRFLSAASRLESVILQMPPQDERVPLAKEVLASIDKRLAHLLVDVAGAEVASVLVDGAAAPRAASRPGAWVMPGAHRVQVAANAQILETEVTCSAGTTCVATLTPSAKKVPQARSTATPSAQTVKTLGYVSWAVSGAAATAGLVFGGLTYDKSQDYQNEALSISQRNDANHVGKDFGAISTGLFVGAGVFALGGLLLVLVAPSLERSAHRNPFVITF